MTTAARTRSTAEVRRAAVLNHAVKVFAETGYHATTVSDVGRAADISQGYVLRLFGNKLDLFLAVVERAYSRICTTLTEAADASEGQSPQEILDAMGLAYAMLIADRNLIMIQVHAQSACDIPEIRDATQRGLASVVDCVRTRSSAEDADVQRFIAYGQLCHLIVTTGLDTVDAGWARTLTDRMTHVPMRTTP